MTMQGMLVAHSTSSPISGYVNRCRWRRVRNVSRTPRYAGVTNSSSASEKSVVMVECARAEPSASGWGRCEM